MNLKIVLFIGLVFLINIASALPLTSLSPITLNVTRGITKTIDINITNPNNYTLYDIDVQGDFLSSAIISELKSNETKSIILNVNVPSSGEFVKNWKIVGFTKINCSSFNSITKEINITPNGALPKNIDICRNDNIRFLNSYGNSIIVRIDDFNVSQLLGDKTAFVQLFNSIGNFVYRIDPLIDLGVIKVTESDQKVHSNADDGNIILNVKSSLEPSTISLSISKTNFTMNYNSLDGSFFIIKNTGIIKAENIRFSGSWLSFDKNAISLNPDEERAVNFVITPSINNVDETGKNYIKELVVLGDNIPKSSFNLTIYIKPSSSVGSGNISLPEYWIKRKEFCSSFPTAPDCLTEPIILYRSNGTGGSCPDVLMNVSGEQVKKWISEGIFKIDSDLTSFSSNAKLDLDNLKLKSSNIEFNTNETIRKQEVSYDDLLKFRDLIYLIIGILFFSIIAGTSFFVFNKIYKKKKQQLETRL